MVRRENHECRLAQSATLKLFHQTPDKSIHPLDRVVIGRKLSIQPICSPDVIAKSRKRCSLTGAKGSIRRLRWRILECPAPERLMSIMRLRLIVKWLRWVARIQKLAEVCEVLLPVFCIGIGISVCAGHRRPSGIENWVPRRDRVAHGLHRRRRVEGPCPTARQERGRHRPPRPIASRTLSPSNNF